MSVGRRDGRPTFGGVCSGAERIDIKDAGMADMIRGNASLGSKKRKRVRLSGRRGSAVHAFRHRR
jgi:hypothetical protein